MKQLSRRVLQITHQHHTESDEFFPVGNCQPSAKTPKITKHRSKALDHTPLVQVNIIRKANQQGGQHYDAKPKRVAKSAYHWQGEHLSAD